MPREAWVLVRAVVQDVYPDQGLPGPQPPLRPPGYPDNSLPGPQPIPGWPAYPGGPGGGLPGGSGPVDPGYSPPWARPQPPYPSHPIYWPPYPDQGLPPFPSHPIAPGGPGRPPLGIWGPTDPRPTPPIYIPIELPPNPDNPNIPTHPIYIPIYPDNALPGPQPVPGWPAYPGGPGGGLPGNAPRPDNSLPGAQPIPGWPAYPGGPGGGLPGNPDQPRPPITPERIEEIKKIVGFLFGNLPPKPEGPPEVNPVTP